MAFEWKGPCAVAFEWKGPCAECGKDLVLTSHLAYQARAKGRGLCPASPGEKKSACTRALASRVMSATNRTHASARMTRKNPMHREDVRAVVTAKARLRGWPESVERGGNGKPLPLPQRLLAATLGWPTEVSVPTRGAPGSRLPHAYKLDLACEALKVGVEVDGASHNNRSRQAQDRKKEAALAGLGWTVLRFTNREVTERLADCVQTVLSTISRLRGPTPTSPTG